MSKNITQDTIIHLFDKDNVTKLADDDDSGGDKYSKLEWCCPETGFYYVCVEHIRINKLGKRYSDSDLVPLSPYVPVDTGEYVVEIMPIEADYCVDLIAAYGKKHCIHLVSDTGPKICIFLNADNGPKCCINLFPKSIKGIFSVENC